MALVDRLQSEKREKVFKELLGRKYSSLSDLDFVYNPMEEILLITIKRLVMEGKINHAEDTLFENISKIKSPNSVYIAGEFYTMLLEMPEDELEKMNFTREEIFSGIEDVKEILGDIVI
ncbi:DUF6483 family protein [Peptostreptococcus equinus]|uniref:DUF6483 family protein n=1 Tax=Peptostreptococcus equinus TaxID=3003601 RepID=A0ABY7JSS1_9FIRM|nr:DUF6483 family protein [Peptostreptococcus sp. CBA3647]WAW15509.1 DUF6483 family protein [Peptostreptococcus sp. CBA3647]